jgi:arylsulfatase A-like enzyme
MRRLNHELGLGLPAERLDPGQGFPSMWMPQQLVDPIVPERYMDLYDRNTFRIPPNVPEGLHTCMRYHLHEYYAMITSLDDQLARLLRAVQDAARDTVVLYTSDHGDQLGCNGVPRAKWQPLQNAYRTPLIVWSPDRVLQGRTVTAPVNGVDLMPTLLGLAGLPVPPELPGASMSGWCTNGTGPKDRELLLGHGNWRALFDGRFFCAVQAAGLSAKPLRFSDTLNDPWDSNNLVDDPAAAKTAARLHAALIQRLKAEGDIDFLAACGLERRSKHNTTDTNPDTQRFNSIERIDSIDRIDAFDPFDANSPL